MKRQNYKKRAAIHGLSMAVFVGACLGVKANDHEGQQNAGGPAAAQAGGQNQLANADQSFVKDAAQAGLMEVKMGQMAKDMGQSAEVKQFGERLVKDHTKANEQLMSIAAKKGMTLAKDMEHKHQSMMDELRNKQGAEFDKEFAKHAVKHHKQDVEKFQKASNDLKDAELKAFAAQTLPTLQQHLEAARTMAKNLGVEDRNFSANAELTPSNSEVRADVDATGNASVKADADASGGIRTDVDTGKDASVNADVDIDTDDNDGKTLGVETKRGDNKVLGIETKPGDGKTLGLNTDKNDGKILGIGDGKDNDAKVEADVDLDRDPSIRADADVDVDNDKNDGKTLGADLDGGRDASARADVDVDLDNDASARADVDVDTDRSGRGDGKVLGIQTGAGDGKTLGLNTRKDDGKLLGIFPAPGRNRADADADVDIDRDDKRIEIDANADVDRDASSAVGAPPSNDKGVSASASVNADKANLTYNDLPKEVQATVKRQGSSDHAGMKIKSEMKNGKKVYRIEHQKDGRNHVMHVAEDGTIVKDNQK